MKRSFRSAFKRVLGTAILSLTVGLPVSVWGALISPSGGETGIVMIREVLSTHVWTGGGVSNDWHDGANWTDGVPANGAVATINSGSVRLTNATADLASFTLGQGATLTIEGWQSAINAAEIVVAGTLTHTAQTVTATNAISGEWVPQHRIWLKGTDFILRSTGKLNADEKGYGIRCSRDR